MGPTLLVIMWIAKNIWQKHLSKVSKTQKKQTQNLNLYQNREGTNQKNFTQINDISKRNKTLVVNVGTY